MRKIFGIFYLSAVICSARSQGIPNFTALLNVNYGPDPQQVMDIYLPAGREPGVSKIIVLIHGGGWSAGRKEDMNGFAAGFYYAFPRYAIVNMGYRLATPDSPAFPKQIEDIGLALNFLTKKAPEYQIMPRFGFFGASAGAHLAMLYGYGIDKGLQVGAIANVVGPTDITDPLYTTNPTFVGLIQNLVGRNTFGSNPGIFYTVSPVIYITPQSPKTISFYGGQDPLIPNNQGATLEDRLDAAGVYNKFYFYPDEGHGFMNPTNVAHFNKKLFWFFKNYL